MCQHLVFFMFILLVILWVLDMWIYSFHQIWKNFGQYLLKYISFLTLPLLRFYSYNYTYTYLHTLLNIFPQVGEDTELHNIREGAGKEGQLSPRQKWWQRPLFLWWALSPQSQHVGAMSETPSTWFIPLLCPGDSLRLRPTQLSGPPNISSGFPKQMAYCGSCFRFS